MPDDTYVASDAVNLERASWRIARFVMGSFSNTRITLVRPDTDPEAAHSATAAMAQMAIEILPKVAAEVAKPLGTIDKVTIFGGGNGSGMSTMSDNVPLVMAKTIQTIKEATGVDIAEIMRAESYEAKVTKNVNVSGMDEAEAREAIATAAMTEAVAAK